MIRGVVAAIKWFPNGTIVPGAGDYFNAAAIEGYTITRSPDNRWAAVGRVILADAYKLTQRPLVLVAPVKGGEFRWAIRSFEIRDGRLRADLGEPTTTPTP